MECIVASKILSGLSGKRGLSFKAASHGTVIHYPEDGQHHPCADAAPMLCHVHHLLAPTFMGRCHGVGGRAGDGGGGGGEEEEDADGASPLNLSCLSHCARLQMAVARMLRTCCRCC